MKINDVEQILGITKANIRFYEKEGLLTPCRSENGYRDYSDSDIQRLKEIVIYRKLGIPVQQIAEILDGVLPLQDALETQIQALHTEISKLNGALMLCREIKAENSSVLDTKRYWELLRQQEHQGLKFHSIVKDYAVFMEPTINRYLIHVPIGKDRNPKMILKHTALFALGFGVLNGLVTGDFLGGMTTQFFSHFVLAPLGFLLWCIVYIPAYVIGKKHPRLGTFLKVSATVLVIFSAVFYITWAVLGPSPT